jgi:hypothetical protein
MIFPVRSNGDNAPSAQRPAQRFAVIAFVQAEAFGFPFALADTEAIEGD